jgi:DNA-binding response OmpR family regulator
MRILVVEDDAMVADGLKRGLAGAGFAVDQVGTAEQAETAIAADEFDLAVIDIGLPQVDGLTLVRRLRRNGSTLPVMIVTARDGLADRVDALDLGADDYMVKPFQLPEVAARCRALIRRTRSATSAQLTIGSVTLDLTSRTVELDGHPLDVTRREWSILECLALDTGRVVRKERLLRAIAGWDEELTPNAVEVYVSRLRAKLGDALAIRTVRGLGYRLDDPAA